MDSPETEVLPALEVILVVEELVPRALAQIVMVGFPVAFGMHQTHVEVEVKMGKAEQVMSDQELRVVEWNYLVGFAGWQIYWWAV